MREFYIYLKNGTVVTWHGYRDGLLSAMEMEGYSRNEIKKIRPVGQSPLA